MTNLNIAKLYLANNTNATATQIDTAVTDGTALTAINALTTAAFVEAAYQAAFGRAADAEGLAYWSNEIDVNGMAKDDAFMTALNYGATVYVAPTVDAPLVIGTETFTAATVSATDDVAVAAAKATAEAAADGTAVGASVVAMVAVVDTATAATAVTAIDAAEAAVAATTTFTLTTGADNPSLTTGNDTISSTINTFSANDNIADASTVDNDTLNIEALSGTLTSTTSITNVENINLTVLSGTLIADTSAWTGVNALTLKDSTGGLTTTSLASTGIDFTVSNSTGNINLGFAAATVAGANDSVSLTLDNVSNGGTITAANIETLNLVTTADTTINSVVNGPATVSISGGDAFTATAAFGAAATTIDARDAADVSILVTDNATVGGGIAVLTASGDDTVNSSVATNNASSLFNLGAGTDTLIFSGASATAATSTFIGVENISARNAGDALDFTNADSAIAVDFQGGGNASVANAKSGTTLTNTVAGGSNTTVALGFGGTVMGETTTINLVGGATTSVAVTNAKTVTVNYDATSVTDFAADETATGTEVTTNLTLNYNAGTITSAGTTGIDATSTVTDLTIEADVATNILDILETEAMVNLSLETKGGLLDVDSASGGLIIGGVAGAGTNSTAMESVIVKATGGAITIPGVSMSNVGGVDNILLDASGGLIDADAAGTAAVFHNTGGNIGTVTLSGDNAITANFTVTAGNVNTFTSTNTNTVTTTITNAGAATTDGTTVTLGNAILGQSNIITMAGTNVKNNITGGTGVDTIVSIDGDDTINGGAGNDGITAAGGADTVTLGAGTDVYTFAAAGTTGTGGTTAAALAASHDVITDFKGSATDADTIDGGAAIVLSLGGAGAATVATATVAAVNTAGLVTGWATTSASGTLAEKIAVVEATINANGTLGDATAAINQSLLFVDSGKTYLFVSDGVDGLATGDDMLIELNGITASAGVTLSGGDISNIA